MLESSGKQNLKVKIMFRTLEIRPMLDFILQVSSLQPNYTLELTEEFLQIYLGSLPEIFDLIDLGWGPEFKSTTVDNEPLKAK